jgi:hypothetical protein
VKFSYKVRDSTTVLIYTWFLKEIRITIPNIDVRSPMGTLIRTSVLHRDSISLWCWIRTLVPL